MSPFYAGLAAAGLLAIVAVALVANELAEHRLAERVRRTAVGAVPDKAPRRSLASLGAGVLRLLDVSGMVRFLASQQDRIQVERTLVPLGVPATMAAPLLVAVKLLFLVAGPAAALAWHIGSGRGGNMALPLLMGAAAGVLAPNMILSQLRKRRVAALNRGMADTLDLLVVCAEAGLGLESAIDRVSNDLRRANPAMSLEFALLSQEMRLLPDRSAAMERFAERAEVEGLRRVAATLSQAMRYGTPLGTALRALAADERQARLIRMEEKAARLPALLVLPLILFILPPLFLVLVGPSILQLFDAIGAMQ
jgi:tight adherence protein C